MTEDAPRNMAELKAIRDPAARGHAAQVYIGERAERARREALAVRDEAILILLKSNGPTATAELVGVSVSTVKLVRSRG